MSIDHGDIDDGARPDASQLLARAGAVLARADRGLADTIQDFFVPDDARLDDRTRATLTLTLAAMVAAVEGELRRQAARSLTAAGDDDRARWIGEGDATFDRLIVAGVLRDPELMRELIGRTRQDLLADTLSTAASDESGAASLLARLSASADARVADAAVALMAAEGRRRSFLDNGRMTRTELPAELHHRLVWWVAAAIREQLAGAEVDCALADAALRSLSAHDEGDRAEGAAIRLALAIDPRPDEVPALLTHAISGCNVALFVALIGHALSLEFTAARQLVVGERDPLWLALRAVELDRATVARIGLALGGDLEAFADRLDAIMAVTPAEARAALAPLSLPADFRAAIAVLEAAR